jgi:hypothetical protein
MIVRASIPLILAVVASAICHFAPPPNGVQEAGVILELPSSVGGLVGYREGPSAEEKRMLPTDTLFAKATYITRDAALAERDVAHVSIVLTGTDSRSIHKPEVCLPGQGWTVDSSQVTTVDMPGGRQLRVRDLAVSGTFLTPEGKSFRRRAHYVYWFVGTDFTTPDHFQRIWRSTWDAVVSEVTHRWAYVAVMAAVTDEIEPALAKERPRTDEQTLRLISYLIQELAPQFQKDLMP